MPKYVWKTWGFSLLSLSLTTNFMALLALKKNISLLIEWEIFSLGASTFVVSLIFDWMSLCFLGTVSVISSSIMFYCIYYMASDKTTSRFIWLLIMFIASMMILIVSPNLMSLLLGWDGLGLTSYCLVIYYQSETSESSGMLTILSNRLGDVGLLVGICLWSSFGSWNYNNQELESTFLLSLMLCLAAFTKSAQMPFSAWLPAAMAAPTPISALVHSSTLVTAGVYLSIRFFYLISSSGLFPYMFIISYLTLFAASHAAWREMDLKKIIAFSTLSQLGLMMSVVSSGFPSLAFFHLIMHAMFKSSLFMCAGVLIHESSGCQDLRKLESSLHSSPLLALVMSSCLLALSGFFFLAGFFSKDFILEQLTTTLWSTDSNLWGRAGFMMMCYTLGMTTAYSFRLIFLMSKICSPSKTQAGSADCDNMVLISLTGVWLYSVIGGFLFSWWMFGGPDLAIINGPKQKYSIILWMLIFTSINLILKEELLAFWSPIDRWLGTKSNLIKFLEFLAQFTYSKKIALPLLKKMKSGGQRPITASFSNSLYEVCSNSEKDPFLGNFPMKMYKSVNSTHWMSSRYMIYLWRCGSKSSFLSSELSMKLTKDILNLGYTQQKTMDLGWSEMYGGAGASKSLYKSSNYFLSPQFVVMVFGSLIWSLILILLCF